MATAKLTVPILLEWKDIEAYMAQHDIVEVVRCKDCKHFMPLTEYSLCVAHGSDAVDADDFCSWAERKETEDAEVH